MAGLRRRPLPVKSHRRPPILDRRLRHPCTTPTRTERTRRDRHTRPHKPSRRLDRRPRPRGQDITLHHLPTRTPTRADTPDRRILRTVAIRTVRSLTALDLRPDRCTTQRRSGRTLEVPARPPRRQLRLNRTGTHLSPRPNSRGLGRPNIRATLPHQIRCLNRRWRRRPTRSSPIQARRGRSRPARTHTPIHREGRTPTPHSPLTTPLRSPNRTGHLHRLRLRQARTHNCRRSTTCTSSTRTSPTSDRRCPRCRQQREDQRRCTT